MSQSSHQAIGISELKQDQAASTGIGAPSRVFVPDDITVDYLCGLYKGRTALQGDALASAYFGKWMRVSGSIRDVEKYGEAFRVTTFIGPDHLVGDLTFDKRWTDQISMLKRGSDIKVIGKLKHLDDAGLMLEECEF